MSEMQCPISLLEEELQQFDENGSWLPIYQRLKNEASMNHNFTVKVARRPENRTRNRYRDVSPYDHSRVSLQNGTNDYINASLVEAPEANRKYVLSQGPLKDTSGHFWQMVWEQDSKAIVMLNRVIERETLKCSQYWPLGARRGFEDEIVFEDVAIKVTLLDEKDMSYYVIRKLEMEFLEMQQKKEVLQFQYMSWPDFGVPQSPAAFLNFLMAVRKSGALERDVGPAVVHCSAGIGRSGTFCLVDTCLVLIEQSRDMSKLDLRSILLDMRKYRMGLIQTADQLRFSYVAVIEGGKKILDGSLENGFEEKVNEKTLPPPKPVRSTVNRAFVEESESDDSDTEDFIINDDGSDSENSNGSAPPLPPRRFLPVVDMDSEEDEDEDTTDLIPNDQKPDENAVENNLKPAEDPGRGEFGIRRRNREERIKNTAKQIELMKKRQQEAEINFQRRGFRRAVYIGIGISLTVVGGYLLYSYFF